ncbi:MULTISPECIES: DUF4124 domain-containing protein [Vibrio]|uniref:DUF4124 domain-containing protein n=1 Tax=Vibrio algicola TaxID=2662262 RepID=A0A5Q0TFF1_9VIBR|nr:MULTISPECIES: DUF4124 domain-containing protein [Vibrio]MBD1576027.1 DUF4124 domain-containing protein [Vibrio sp. S11_S32]
MKFSPLLLIFLIAPLSHANEIYKWTDSKGVMHLSDTPPPKSITSKNKEKLVLPEVKNRAPSSGEDDGNNTATKTSDSVTTDQTASVKTDDSAASLSADEQVTEIASSEKKADYKDITVDIESPSNDETLRSSRGLMTIQTSLNRKLGIGERLQLVFDGTPYGAPQTQKYWELKGVERGEHSLKVQVVQSGKVIASSSVVTVFLHKTSVK